MAKTPRRKTESRGAPGVASAADANRRNAVHPPTAPVVRGEYDGVDASLDRRDFLKVAGAQAGLLVAGQRTLESVAAASAPARKAPAIIAKSYDVAVIGAGAWGGWTSYWLRRMGAKVLLIDAYGPGNSRSTSGDETRGVRTSYGDRPHGELWMRWASRAAKRWKSWDDEWGKDLKMRLFFTPAISSSATSGRISPPPPRASSRRSASVTRSSRWRMCERRSGLRPDRYHRVPARTRRRCGAGAARMPVRDGGIPEVGWGTPR